MKQFQYKNVVIGKPIVHPWYIFCEYRIEWDYVRGEIYYTDERFLPKIMVDLGIVKSISEVRRNQPQLMKNLDKLDYLEIKWGKNKLFILLGN